MSTQYGLDAQFFLLADMCQTSPELGQRLLAHVLEMLQSLPSHAMAGEPNEHLAHMQTVFEHILLQVPALASGAAASLLALVLARGQASAALQAVRALLAAGNTPVQLPTSLLQLHRSLMTTRTHAPCFLSGLTLPAADFAAFELPLHGAEDGPVLLVAENETLVVYTAAGLTRICSGFNGSPAGAIIAQRTFEHGGCKPRWVGHLDGHLARGYTADDGQLVLVLVDPASLADGDTLLLPVELAETPPTTVLFAGVEETVDMLVVHEDGKIFGNSYALVRGTLKLSLRHTALLPHQRSTVFASDVSDEQGLPQWLADAGSLSVAELAHTKEAFLARSTLGELFFHPRRGEDAGKLLGDDLAWRKISPEDIFVTSLSVSPSGSHALVFTRTGRVFGVGQCPGLAELQGASHHQLQECIRLSNHKVVAGAAGDELAILRTVSGCALVAGCQAAVQLNWVPLPNAELVVEDGRIMAQRFPTEARPVSAHGTSCVVHVSECRGQSVSPLAVCLPVCVLSVLFVSP